MSNPTTHTEQFSGSLGGFIGVDPIRYSAGLLLESAGTNLHTNPVARNNGTRWGAYGGSGARSTSLSLVHPETGATYTTGWRTDFANGNQNAGALTILGTWTAGNYLTASALVKASGTMVGKNIRLRLAFNGGSQATAYSTQVLTPATGGEQIVTITAAVDFSDRTFVDFVIGNGDTIAAGTDILEITAGQFEDGQVRSSFIYGSSGSGYAFSGSADASTSTRAASSASISPSGIFDTYLGAIVFVATPTIETGAEEIWGELGEKLAGADHIRWGRDSTKHPFVEWSGNDSAYTRVTLTPTVDAGDEHFYSIEWHVGDADFRLYLDGNPSDNDTIPSPQEDYGAGPLKLQATAGGVIYNGLMICNARLTDAQRARLQEVDHWSVRTLERLRVGVARPQFELRPY